MNGTPDIPKKADSTAGSARPSFAQWAGLHLTGLVLVVFVVSHLWSVHYGADVASEGFTYAGVAAKLRSPLFRFFDLGLLGLALVHGLLGTQRVIVDLVALERRTLAALNVGLIVLGLAGFYYGWSIYLAFVR